MEFQPANLIKIRTQLGISKAEAARRLNMSAMGYGRYEKGEREPSFQTVCYIAQIFGTTSDFLYGKTDDPNADSVTVAAEQNPDLFDLVQTCLADEKTAERLLAYYKKINS